MYFQIKVILLIALYSHLTCAITKKCYWNSLAKYKYFSSKTPYNSVRGDIRDSIVKLQGCDIVSIWALIRHGKRNPGSGFAKKMKEALKIRKDVIESYNYGKSSLCAQDIENLRNAKYKELFKGKHTLSEEGYEEMFGIGERLRGAFAELLRHLKHKSYIIRSAYGHWLEDGVDMFIKGLSKKLTAQKPHRKYDIMAPYTACKFYSKEIKHNPEIYKEATKYTTTPEYIAAKERIQKRTGINYELTSTNITSLYDFCRYSWYGIDNRPSAWCALFNREDLEVIEYYGDLRHYYRNGYGTPMNKLFGRIPMRDLYRSLRNYKEGHGKKMIVYFSHATMMDMVYSALGWYKDELPLTSAFRNPDRKWKSTFLSPFAANLIAVLHRCYEGDEVQFKVMFYNNEKLVTSICDRGVCSWQEFENRFKQYENATMDFCPQ